MDAAAAGLVQDVVLTWASADPTIRAVALVGSWARRAARPDSDIDLMVLCQDPSHFRRQDTWLADMKWHDGGFEIARTMDEDYGAAWSKRLLLQPDAEVEITFAHVDWACIDPVDPGTREVVGGGCKALLDKDGDVGRLIEALRRP
jgi:streptomycin adenylyltransferase